MSLRRPSAWLAASLSIALSSLSAPVDAQSPKQPPPSIASGRAAYDRHDYALALRIWQGLLPSFERSKDRREGDLYSDIGLAYYALDDRAKALPAFVRAGALHHAQGAGAAEGDDLRNAGIMEQDLGRYAEALVAHRQALAIHRARGDRLAEAGDLGNIGIVEDYLGRYADALASHGAALTIVRALKNRSEEADELTNLGNVEADLGRYDDALRSLRQALAIHHDIGNASGEATDVGDIGTVDQDLGRYDDALAAHQRALAADRALGNKRGEAADLGNLGNALFSLGRYDEALEAQQKALALSREIGDRAAEAGDLIGIGTIENDIGGYAEALASEIKALEIDRAIGNPVGAADALGDAGLAQMRLGRYAEALASHAQALSINRAIGNRLGEGYDLANAGSAQESLGQNSDALASYRAALTIFRAIGNRGGEALALGSIANVQGRLGQYADMLESAKAGVALDTEIAAPEYLWRAQRSVALAESQLGHRDEALAAFDASLAQIEETRATLSARERAAFFSERRFAYDEYAGYLERLDAAFPGMGYDRKALEIFERKSARAALEQIGSSAARHYRGVPPDTVAAEAAAGRALDAAQRLVSKLEAAPGADAAAVTAARRSLDEARAHSVSVDADLRAHYPDYYRLRHPQPLLAQCGDASCPSIGNFQQNVLEPGEVMLAYDLLPGRSLLWIVDRERVRLVRLRGSDEIDKAVALLGAHVAGMLAPGIRAGRLERSAAADIPGFAADAYALYRMLLPGDAASAVAGARSLVVVPSGSLYRLAFETLVSRDPAGAAQPHYLIEDLPVSYVPSASLLALVRAADARRTAAREPLFAVANPAFGSAPAGDARGATTYADLQLAATRAAFAGLGGAVFPALPGTQTEADAVRTALNAPADSLVSGEAATREHVLDLNAHDLLRTYQYVLFATHAVLPSEIVGLQQPAIVLAHPEAGDGLLTMADVLGLTLDADFVALSACNTGVDTGGSSGEGISGLTRAFLYAGTPAISVTLWQVDDAAAPQITPAFFAGMHAGGITPAEALRQAKLAMLRSPRARFRHAYAWGPSVIFGDGDRAPEKGVAGR